MSHMEALIFIRSAIGVAIMLLSSSAAFSAPNKEIRVTFATPLPGKINALALANVVWSYKDTTCLSLSEPSNTTDRSACRELAKHFGPVQSFTSPAGEFDGEKLAECNKTARQ